MTQVESGRRHAPATACERCGSSDTVAAVTFTDRVGERRTEHWCAACKQAKLVRTRPGNGRPAAARGRTGAVGAALAYVGYLLLAVGAVLAALSLLGIIAF
jgi:hypothetical protein